VARKILIYAVLIETVISLVWRFADRMSDNETLRKQEARLAAGCQRIAPRVDFWIEAPDANLSRLSTGFG
jgi:hypothetical protein